MEIVKAIFYKKMNPGDLWNIDRPAGTVIGGGGQTFIDLAGIDDSELQSFLELGISEEKPGETRRKITIVGRTIGHPNQISEITFDPRSNRPNYRITNQHNQRHPAWATTNGFPTIPPGATGSQDVTNIPHLMIYIARTVEGNYYVGYVDSEGIPENWPGGLGLERMFQEDRRGILQLNPHHDADTFGDIPPLVEEILLAWEKSPNVLLYGPPGTGKTHSMQWLWKNITEGIGSPAILLNPDNDERPFEGNPFNMFSGETRIEWLTFHQNFSYEDFVIGLRPVTNGEGVRLEPKLGVLLDVAVGVDPATGSYNQAVIFIDELNRGNVSRIFGQFLTFLEADKRATDDEGTINPYRLPLPLPELHLNGNKTEEVVRMDGSRIELPWPFYFPFPVYILASMNSVDRAVAPLDTALARRFLKIECGPAYDYLAEVLNLDVEAIDLANPETWSPQETAYLLLKRLNDYLATVLGPDFELGPSYMKGVGYWEDEEDAFLELAEIWDQSIFPQLMERFANRQERVVDFLKVEAAAAAGDMEWYPFRIRGGGFQAFGGEIALERCKLRDLDVNDIKKTLRFLANGR